MEDYFDYDSLIEKLGETEEITRREAESLAQKFFTATYFCNKEIRKRKTRCILMEEIKAVVYRDSINESVGKNVTEKKIVAEADTEYLKSLRMCEEATNELDYYRRLFKVLENGYTLYKLLSREQ